MSFMIYQVRCRKCGFEANTSFGVVGTTMIAEPVTICPRVIQTFPPGTIFEGRPVDKEVCGGAMVRVEGQ